MYYDDGASCTQSIDEIYFIHKLSQPLAVDSNHVINLFYQQQPSIRNNSRQYIDIISLL